MPHPISLFTEMGHNHRQVYRGESRNKGQAMQDLKPSLILGLLLALTGPIWFLVSSVSAVPWPQIWIAQNWEQALPLVALMSVVIALVARLAAQSHSTANSLIMWVAVLGNLACWLFAGFYTFDFSALEGLGKLALSGDNPYAPTSPDTAPWADLVSLSWGPLVIGLSAGFAALMAVNATAALLSWTVLCAACLVLAITLAVGGLGRTRMNVGRGVILWSLPLFLVLGVGALSPLVLALPLLALAFSLSARGRAVPAAAMLALASGLSPAFVLLASALLLPGPCLWPQTRITIAESVKAIILLLVLGAAQYSPAIVASFGGGGIGALAQGEGWLAMPGTAMELLPAWMGFPPIEISFWLRMLMIELGVVCLGVAGVIVTANAKHRSHTLFDQRRPDRRALFAGLGLCWGLILWPPLWPSAALLAACILVRTPNLGIAFFALGCLVSFGAGQMPGIALPMAQNILALPLVFALAGLAVDWFLSARLQATK